MTRTAWMALVLVAACSSKETPRQHEEAARARAVVRAETAAKVDQVHEAAMQPQAGAKSFSFHVVEPSGARDIVVQNDVIHIGRVPSSQIQMQDDKVGRMHAMIESDQRGITLTDLGNGTSLNGTKLVGATSPLKSGDEIELGASKIVVTF